MKKNSVVSWLLILIGICAIACAVMLAYRVYGDERDKQIMASELADAIYDIYPDPKRGLIARGEEGEKLPALEIRGVDVTGYLTFPALQKAVAVQAFYETRPMMPHYFSGDPANGTLRISGIDASGLNVGDTVVFSDVMGMQYVYEIEGISERREEEVKADLVLYSEHSGQGTQIVCMEAEP